MTTRRSSSLRAPGDPHRPLVGLALAVGVLLAVPPPASAFIQCCRTRALPPTLTAFCLPATSAEDGLRRAAVLGFRARTDASGEARAALDRGCLAWPSAQGPIERGGIATRTGYPVFSSTVYMLCGPGPIPDRPTGSEPGAEHPNGALQVTGVLALVADLDAACRTVPSGLSWLRLDLAFGAPRSHPALGARSRTGTTSDGTMLTVLVADGGEGPAARWLAEGGTRWLGVTVSVRDLDAMAGWLAGGGVAFERLAIDGVPYLVAEPDGPGGAIVLFHPADRAWGLRPS